MINKQYGRQMFVNEYQSGKGYIRRQAWTNPAAALATLLKTGAATSSSVTTTVSTFDAQPDFARKISVDPGGTTADVPAGDVTVNGTNIRGETISDTITFAANATAAIATVKAFKTVTSVVFPIQDGASATYDIGTTDALGLDRCMSEASVIDAYQNGTRETTAATITYDSSDVSKNTMDPNTALDGTKDFSVIFVATETTAKAGSTS
jgi:hypothetical protein